MWSGQAGQPSLKADLVIARASACSEAVKVEVPSQREQAESAEHLLEVEGFPDLCLVLLKYAKHQAARTRDLVQLTEP